MNADERHVEYGAMVTAFICSYLCSSVAEISLLNHTGVSIDGGPFRGTPTYYIYSPTGNLVTRQVGTLTQEAAEEIIQHGNMAGY